MLRNSQSGIGSFQSFLLLVCIVLIGRGLFSLIPLYYERSSAVDLLNEAVDEARIADHTKRQLMDNINSKFSANKIRHPNVASLEVIREARNYILTAKYSAKGSYFSNIELVVNFEPISIDVTDILATQ